MRSLVVANRGEIARRVFRTAARRGLTTVAVYSDADADAPFVAEADLAVRLPGSSPAETYLRGDLVVAAALAAGADAVHPGYGFLSESADFARAVIDAGLTWVGPPPEAIAAMGSKIAAKQMMAEAGVPTLPWSESVADAEAIGFPLLVKASAGGGGRGMRVVHQLEDLDEAVAAASREAGSAFGDSTVFLERYLETARHIELQIVADSHGTVVSLYERECSIQRRHQKILEESPSPAVDDDLRVRMGADAIAAARAVGYVGVGTVEFVLDADGRYSFLEMNTRLQVEHPVTEAVTGLDLVALQLAVAAGEPLPPEALSPPRTGHAIEVRLYAEDAERDFAPAVGRLRELWIDPAVRCDSGVVSGSAVTPYYDAMLAKVIAHAPTRDEAADALAAALRRARIHGVTTNRDLLVAILGEPDFRAGNLDTGYLEGHDVARLAASPLTATDRDLHAVAAALGLRAHHRRSATVLADLPAGWRNNPSQPETVTFAALAPDGPATVVGLVTSRTGVTATVGERTVGRAEHISATPTTVTFSLDGIRRRFHVVVDPTGRTVDVDSPAGATSAVVVPPYTDPATQVAAGSLVAPMPGVVLRVVVAPGQAVEAGAAMVVLEAMKMEHTVTAPAAGVVAEVGVSVGQQVDAGTVLAVMTDQ